MKKKQRGRNIEIDIRRRDRHKERQTKIEIVLKRVKRSTVPVYWYKTDDAIAKLYVT